MFARIIPIALRTLRVNVLKAALLCGFDSFRAHQLFNNVSLVVVESKLADLLQEKDAARILGQEIGLRMPSSSKPRSCDSAMMVSCTSRSRFVHTFRQENLIAVRVRRFLEFRECLKVRLSSSNRAERSAHFLEKHQIPKPWPQPRLA